MNNKLTIILAASLLLTAPVISAAQKANADTDNDGKISYEEYRHQKIKRMSANLKKWITMAMAILMPKKSKR